MYLQNLRGIFSAYAGGSVLFDRSSRQFDGQIDAGLRGQW